MKCKCPKCKIEFDITEITEPIMRKAIDDFANKIKEEIIKDEGIPQKHKKVDE